MAVSKSVMAIGMIVIAIAAFAVGLFSSPYIMPEAEPKTMWDIVQERGKLIIGTDPYWPPYQYLDEEGNLIGFEVDLIEMIAEQLDLTVEWKTLSFDAIIPEVKAKSIDLGVSGFSITPERSEVIQYTIPHSVTEGQIIMLNSTAVAKGITELTSLTELSGLKCGTESGTTQEAELDDLITAGDIPSDTLSSYSSFAEALTALKTGLIDCVYAETPVSSWWILEAEQQEEEPIVIIYSRSYWPVAFLAHLDSDILVSKISGALAEIISEGTLDELKVQWKS
ncbi:MAG: amino acid ABC transporter substrate-binding protein [Dehalococcoidia bacterium]|nr:MAG: amino acid ABC transporter substrate-binding protein [Dehalococcoidia bacterium]